MGAEKNWAGDPEDLQKRPAEMDKKISDKWNKTNNATAMVDESQRKTGEVSAGATSALRGHGTTPNQ